MKILFVSEARNWSGGSNQMLLTGLEFQRRGHEVTVAVPDDGYCYSKFSQEGLKCLPLGIKQDYDIASAMRLKAYAAACGADIVHAHHPRAHAVALIARHIGMKAPLIVTRRVIFRIRVNPFSAIKYRSPKIDRYIAVCNATKTELVKGGVRAEKISVIPSGVIWERFETARAARAAFEFKPPYRIGVIGHYSWFKGHDYMVQAAPLILKEIPQARFVFAGRDTDKLLPMAEKLGVASSFDILGERRDVPEILSTLHVFAMPSLQEGIATALMEAQAAGVPSVASSIGGIPDVMLDGKTGILFPSENPRALADAVIRMIKDEAARREMSAAALQRVRENFTIPAVSSRLLDCYGEVCGGCK